MFKSFLRFAKKKKLVEAMPDVVMPKVYRKIRTTLTIEQVNALLDACMNFRVTGLILLITVLKFTD